MIYTQLELTEKKYKVNQAVVAAKRTLDERHNTCHVCVDVIQESGKDLESPITLKELNDLSYQIVNRSLSKYDKNGNRVLSRV